MRQKNLKYSTTVFIERTEKEIKIGYLYPRNSYDLMKAVVNGIYTFAKLGKYHGEKDLYTMAGTAGSGCKGNGTGKNMSWEILQIIKELPINCRR